MLLAGQKVSLPLLYFHQIPPADVLEGDRRLHLLRKAFRIVRSRQKKKISLIALGCVFRKRWQGSSAREEHHVGWSNWRSHPWVVASSWSYQPIQERKRLLGKLSFFQCRQTSSSMLATVAEARCSVRPNCLSRVLVSINESWIVFAPSCIESCLLCGGDVRGVV